MGGPGSGTWYRWDKRSTVEDFLRLDIRKLQRTGVLDEPGGFGRAWWDGGTGKRTADIWLHIELDRLTLHYKTRRRGEDWREVKEPVPIDRTACHFGGARPWFRCPGCGSRRAVLYGGSLFRCRRCHGLPYTSQCEPDYDRLLRKARKIRGRLGGESRPLCPFPPKPKGMHWRTYYRLQREALEAEERGWSMAMRRFARVASALDGG